LIFASSGNTTGYAWATEAGWINFGCDDCSVNVTNTAITGYAWSQNYGWINFSPTGGGGIANSAGALSGSAWGENTGWIDFDLTTINSEGQFTGTASGDVVGTVVFTDCGDSCSVETIWTPSINEPTGGNGYSSSISIPSPTPSPDTFKILIGGGMPRTNNPIVIIDLTTKVAVAKVQISFDPNFNGIVPEVYEPRKSIILPPGDGKKTIYVRFLDSMGRILQTVSTTVILDTKPPEIKVSQIMNLYKTEDNVIISGTVNGPATIIFYFDNQYASVDSDSKGNWKANFGQLSPGTHHISLRATDELGNTKTTFVDITVKSPEEPIQSSIFGENGPFSIIPPIIDSIRQKVGSLFSFLLPEIFRFPKIITISKNPSLVMQGKWNLLPVKAQGL